MTHMRILDDLISGLRFDAPIRDIRLGFFQTAVLTRNCGLASTLPRDALQHPPPLVKEPGRLLEKTARDLAQMAYSDRLLEAAIGMATINSLLEINPSSCLEQNAADLILHRGEGKRIAIVGHFPFLPRIKQKAAELFVIERNPREGDLDEHQAHRVIPQADVVAITGTALSNHTLEELLQLCRPGAFVLLLGDTAPLSPILFEHGVDAVCGTVVTDPEAVLRSVSQGANFRQITGTRRLTLLKS